MRKNYVLMEIMKTNAITVKDLSRWTGLTVQSIYGKLNGQTEWNMEQIEKILRHLGVVEHKLSVENLACLLFQRRG